MAGEDRSWIKVGVIAKCDGDRIGRVTQNPGKRTSHKTATLFTLFAFLFDSSALLWTAIMKPRATHDKRKDQQGPQKGQHVSDTIIGLFCMFLARYR